jgi:hypothetical protein
MVGPLLVQHARGNLAYENGEAAGDWHKGSLSILFQLAQIFLFVARRSLLSWLVPIRLAKAGAGVIARPRYRKIIQAGADRPALAAVGVCYGVLQNGGGTGLLLRDVA